MLYTIKNKALEVLGIEKLDSLSNDELARLCTKLSLSPIYLKLDKGGRNTRPRLNRAVTLQAIRRNLSVNFYIPKEHFTEKMWDVFEDSQSDDQMANHILGNQTYQHMAALGLGVHNLQPGQTAQLEMPEGYFKEDLSKKPFMTHLEVSDTNGNIYTMKTVKINEIDENGKSEELIKQELVVEGKKKPAAKQASDSEADELSVIKNKLGK